MKTFFLKTTGSTAGGDIHSLHFNKHPLASKAQGQGKYLAVKAEDEADLERQLSDGYPSIVGVVTDPIGE